MLLGEHLTMWASNVHYICENYCMKKKGVARSDAGCCNLVLLDGSLYCNGNWFSCFAVLVVSARKIMEARSGEDVMSRLV